MAEDKNADQGDAGLGLESEDRLPWLEAADGVEDDGEVSPARLLVMVLGGLLLIGAVLGGAQIAGAIVYPAVLFMASMFFTSIWFTFRDSFEADDATPGD